MPAGVTYDVFLSYHWRDRPQAEKLARWLSDSGLTVFFDRWYLVPGLAWPQVLEGVLSNCRAVAICIGPGGLGPWQYREAHFAIDRQTRDPTLPVVPVMLPGSEPSLGFLALNTWVDLRLRADDMAQLERLLAAVRREAFGPQLQQRIEQTLASICPYRGLLYFREEDAPFFFGRAAATEELVAKLDERNVIAVVGASGSGKSSLVRAGLIPRLRHDRDCIWDIVTLVPGDRPFTELARALLPLLEPQMSEVDRAAEQHKLAEHLGAGSLQLRDVVRACIEKQQATQRVFLLVDQWEELYTLTPDEAVRKRFVDQLLDCASMQSCAVVITLRGDFVGHALAYRPLCDRLQDAQINLGPMTSDELELVIREPAERTGLTFEPGLMERILKAVGDEPGKLPLLEFVLKRLWENRHQGLLLHQVYGDMGELEGALASKAEEVFGRLSPTEQRTAQQVFLQLIRPGEAAEDTRRRAALHRLRGEKARDVVYRLANERLLVTARDEADGDEIIEVSHETLIRNWGRLKSWIDEDREFMIWREWLRGQVSTWVGNKADAGALLRGALLLGAERWLSQRKDQLDEQQQDFISQSIAQRSREEHERAEQALQQKEFEHAQELARLERARADEQVVVAKRLHRQRIMLAVMIIVCLVLFGVVAHVLTDRAVVAEKTDTAYRLSIASKEHLTSDPRLSNLFALRAGELTYAADKRFLPETELALVAATRATTPDLTLPPQPKELYRVAFLSDGQRFATVGGDGRLVVWDTRTGQPSMQCSGHAAELTSVTISSDGTKIATASRDKTVMLWSADTCQRPVRLEGHSADVFDVAFSPDGALVATAGKDGQIGLWSSATGKPLRWLHGHGERVYGVAFSPDGTRLISGSADRTVRVWDVKSGRTLNVLRQHTAEVYCVAYSKDGRYFASGGRDSTARIWDAASGAQTAVLRGHTDTILSLAIDATGTRLATTSSDRTVRVWDPRIPLSLLTLYGHHDWVQGVSFSSDGRLLATTSGDKTAKVWDVSASHAKLSGHLGAVYAVAYSPDGTRIATGSDDQTAILWDSTSGTAEVGLRGHAGRIARTLFSASGDRLFTASQDGTVRGWDARTGAPLALLSGHARPVTGISLSRDGRFIVSSSEDGSAVVWDVPSARQSVRLLDPEKKGLMSVAIDPKATRIATGRFDGLVTIWKFAPDDPSASVPLATLAGHARAVVSIAWSDDGQYLATASNDETVRLWDATQGALIHTLTGHGNAVTRVAFSPNGRQLASASVDGTVRIWDVATGKQDYVLARLDAAVLDLAYGRDGKTMAVARSDGIAQLLDVAALAPQEPGRLMEIARRKGAPPLDSMECIKYAALRAC